MVMGSIPFGCVLLTAFFILILANAFQKFRHNRRERKIRMEKIVTTARMLFDAMIDTFVVVGVGSLGGAVSST